MAGSVAPSETRKQVLECLAPLHDWLQRQLGGHRDGCLQTPVDGTFVREKSVHPAGGFPLDRIGLQRHADVDAADDQNVILELDLANRFRDQPFIRRINLTRLQRASEGSRQSTRSGRDHVIQSGRMRLRDVS